MAPLALYLLNPDRDLACNVSPCDAVGDVSKRNTEGSSSYSSPMFLPKRREFFGSLSNAKQSLDTQDVVDPPPTNLKVIGGILGALGFVAIAIIAWRARVSYRRRRNVRSPTPSWGSSAGDSLPSLRRLALVDRNSQQSSLEKTKPSTHHCKKWVTQIPVSSSSQVNEKELDHEECNQAVEMPPTAQNPVVEFSQTETQPQAPERLITRLSHKLSVRRPPRPLPKTPPRVPDLKMPSSEQVLIPAIPPTSRNPDHNIEAEALRGQTASTTSPSAGVAVPFVFTRQLSATASGRVIPPAPTTIPTGPLPSIPTTGQEDAATTISLLAAQPNKDDHLKRKPSGRLPFTRPPPIKTRASHHKNQTLGRVEVGSTVTAGSQVTRNTSTFITVPTQVQPEKSPARSDSFKHVSMPRSHSQKHQIGGAKGEEEGDEDEQVRHEVEQQIMEMLGEMKPQKTLRRTKKKAKVKRNANLTKTVASDDKGMAPPPVPTVTQVPSGSGTKPTDNRTHSFDCLQTSRPPRLVTVHRLYTPSLPDELRIQLGEPLRLLAEYQDGWIAVERVGMSSCRTTKAPFHNDAAARTQIEQGSEPGKGVIPRFCILDRNDFVKRARTKGVKAVMREVERNLKGMSWSSMSSRKKGGKRVPFGYGVMHGVAR